MRSEARIVDASLNRAGEGLRVLEDIARFGLDDAALTERCKRARHALHTGAERLPFPEGMGMTARDTPGDVGTSTRTETEGRRQDLVAVARAAAGRTAEALRSIEEVAKCVGGDGWAFESLRYEVYELGRLVCAGLSPRAPQWRLCVLLTKSLCLGRGWEEIAEAAIEGGADCLQLREKELTDRELLARAQRLVSLAGGADHRVWVVINDRPDIAVLSRADGVHVGQYDLRPGEVRAVAGRGLLVGVSTADMRQASEAVNAGASYVGLGPMFTSSTKPRDILAGEGYLRSFLADEALSATPHLCIGGITPENAGTLARAGAKGVAVSSAVCGAGDPKAACRRLLEALGGAGPA